MRIKNEKFSDWSKQSINQFVTLLNSYEEVEAFDEIDKILRYFTNETELEPKQITKEIIVELQDAKELFKATVADIIVYLSVIRDELIKQNK